MQLTRSLRRFVARRINAAVPLALLLQFSCSACLAWGVTAHNYCNGLAIDCLPAQLRPLYDANRPWITRHSVDPDEWRRTNFAAESPRHFIDLDTAGPEAVAAYPSDYWIAAGLFGKAAVDKNGTVPWRIGEYYGKLVRAFRAQDAKSIVEISTWLGHYSADVHVPFHATADYDGQRTGQKGIHARFETALVDQLIKPGDLHPSDATTLKEPVSAAFSWARASLALCPAILDADKAAVQKDAGYGFNYYTAFAIGARPIAIRRIEQSAQDSASLWLSAWIEAGRPAVPTAADVHAGEPLDKATHDPDIPARGAEAGPAPR